MDDTGLIKIKTALISVSDKTGLPDLAKALTAHGCELWSTGGTAKALRDLGYAVRDVSDITGFPEIMDGRVKTLHPKIHGALLSIGGNDQHDAARQKHGIGTIDLLVVNLYPFESTVTRDSPRDDIIENIDIGGPAMLRAAAKNHGRVSVLVDPGDYEPFSHELVLQHGATTLQLRQKLAAKAYAHTAAYDAAIANWMSADTGETMPERLLASGRLAMLLRYGENPHQSAAAYHSPMGCGVLDAEQVQGKELSYNNINDADAALAAVAEFDMEGVAACVIVKHANPCGVACARSLLQAYQKALACDPVSAFGGIVAFNQPLDAATATEVAKIFTEVIIAPGANADAKAILQTKKNLRLLLVPQAAMKQSIALSLKSIRGGFLLQSADASKEIPTSFRVVTKRQPTAMELRDLHFAWLVAKHVKSNAIVFAREGATVGIGAGQMSRIDSTRIAMRKSEDAARALGKTEPLSHGAVLASDAFFPFPDGIEAAAEAGAVAIIQPGGAQKDDEVIAAADRLGLAMLFTGIRHFRH
jgi:phosphoribosylaminoimidazolecarboxamide formyltransferase/IMP cyclohydrolase